jgi:hypothetical protein
MLRIRVRLEVFAKTMSVLVWILLTIWQVERLASEISRQNTLFIVALMGFSLISWEEYSLEYVAEELRQFWKTYFVVMAMIWLSTAITTYLYPDLPPVLGWSAEWISNYGLTMLGLLASTAIISIFIACWGQRLARQIQMRRRQPEKTGGF